MKVKKVKIAKKKEREEREEREKAKQKEQEKAERIATLKKTLDTETDKLTFKKETAIRVQGRHFQTQQIDEFMDRPFPYGLLPDTIRAINATRKEINDATKKIEDIKSQLRELGGLPPERYVDPKNSGVIKAHMTPSLKPRGGSNLKRTRKKKVRN
jgi:N-acetyl-anhydromuramyl-L-alanine amidase AmpD